MLPELSQAFCPRSSPSVPVIPGKWGRDTQVPAGVCGLLFYSPAVFADLRGACLWLLKCFFRNFQPRVSLLACETRKRQNYRKAFFFVVLFRFHLQNTACLYLLTLFNINARPGWWCRLRAQSSKHKVPLFRKAPLKPARSGCQLGTENRQELWQGQAMWKCKVKGTSSSPAFPT